MKVFLVFQGDDILMFEESRIYDDNDGKGKYYCFANEWGIAEKVYFTKYEMCEVEHIANINSSSFVVKEEVFSNIPFVVWAEQLYRAGDKFIITFPDPTTVRTKVLKMTKDEVNRLFRELKYNYEVA